MIFSPLQVWKCHPDNQESITWWVFHLKKMAIFKTKIDNRVKTIQSNWILYDGEDEDWNIFEENSHSTTKEWIPVGQDELREIWQEQFHNAPFSMADIRDRKPMVWAFNSRTNMNPKGKPIFSGYEASKLDTTQDDDKYIKETEELAGPSQFKSGGLFWFFRLNKRIQFEFEAEKNIPKFSDDWLAYNFEKDQWESLDKKSQDNVSDRTYQRISYETLFDEWERFFSKLERKPKYISMGDIAEDTS
ncbi:MAG: hypothetical protein AAB847_02075 [Patescibacteria group bacterium]